MATTSSFNTDTNQSENLTTPAKISENSRLTLFRKVLAEIIGTYLLVFVGAGSAALSAIDENRLSRLGASLAGGFIVTVMIYSIGHISGAHMNPSVSLALAAVQYFPWKEVPFYIAAQLIGAISASYTLRELLNPINPARHLGTTSPSGTNLQALVMEMVATFTMVFITCAVATDGKAVRQVSGVAVGASVCIAGMVGGPISGGSMNPARSLGPAIASASYKGIWVYFIGPITGAQLAAWSYRLIREKDRSTSCNSVASFPCKLCPLNNATEQV